jgi:hypothetical protein
MTARMRYSRPVAIRLLDDDRDRRELARLEAIDSASRPLGGEVLGAEVEGKLVAAISLADGEVIADPFRPTAATVELLELRARQLGGSTAVRGFGRIAFWRRAHARAALAGSPPGAGGRLLQL